MVLDAQKVFDPPKDVKAAVQLHDLRDPGFQHTDLQAHSCACRTTEPEPFSGDHAVFVEMPFTIGRKIEVADPVRSTFKASEGPACANCGNITVLQGSCWLCQTCGNTTGCG